MSLIVYRMLGSFLLADSLLPILVFAQTSGPSLRGQVLDPSGSAVPAITVALTGPTRNEAGCADRRTGQLRLSQSGARNYTLTIRLKGFDDFVKPGIVIARGQPQAVNAQLAVAVAKQQITVTDESTKVSVNPEDNASALVIKGKDLESLSDDPDELQSELEALAGPSAGPNGGQIYIDGFTGGQLPPKSSIREIRVNQNPFSAQYDALGYGRIEILTKPGTDKASRPSLCQRQRLGFQHAESLSRPRFPAITRRCLTETLAGRSTRRPRFSWMLSAATSKTPAS